SIRSKPEISEPWDNGPTALEQATAEQHPQQMEETQIGTDRHTSDHTRQNTIDTVEYGRHQGRLLQIEIGCATSLYLKTSLVSPSSRLFTEASCWIPGSWMCLGRPTQLLSPCPP